MWLKWKKQTGLVFWARVCGTSNFTKHQSLGENLRGWGTVEVPGKKKIGKNGKEVDSSQRKQGPAAEAINRWRGVEGTDPWDSWKDRERPPSLRSS